MAQRRPATSRAEEIRADDEHVIWPFIGEYWRDELGYYRVKIANKCQRNAPEGAPATGEGAAPAARRRGGGWRRRRRGWRRADAVEPIRRRNPYSVRRQQ